MADPDEPGALVAAPEPKLELAPSLADARPNSLVYVDRRGQVRSPARYLAAQAWSYGTIGLTIAAFTIVYGSLLGIAGVAAGGALAGLFGWRIRQGHRMRRAVVLIVNDRVEEAIPILEKVARSRAPARLRAIAEQNLGSCHARRGRHEQALEHQHRAVQLHGSRPRPIALVVRYAEIISLINLDRVTEARALFVERFPQVPAGDFLRVRHWTVELYLALTGADVTIDAEDLHERARTALGLTGGGALLGLTAWAHHRAGDLDQAWHLLREAFDRPGEPIDATLPRLHTWMQAHAAEARAAAPDDDL